MDGMDGMGRQICLGSAMSKECGKMERLHV